MQVHPVRWINVYGILTMLCLRLWRLHVLLPMPSWAMIRCAPLCFVWGLQAAADEEPLALSGVTISPAAAQAITDAWDTVRHQSLYTSPKQLLNLVQQVGVIVTGFLNMEGS
jgi:hypothetical protein